MNALPGSRWQSNWRRLTQAAAWLCSALAAFLLPPPRDLAAGDNTTVAFTAFMVAFLVGVMAVPLAAFRRRTHARGWAAVAGALFVLGCVALFEYRDHRARWSVPYAGERVVTGGAADLTPLGREYRARFPLYDGATLVANTGGRPALVWRQEAIRSHARTLDLLYIACAAAFAGAIISVLQVLELLQSGRTRAAAKATAPSRSRLRNDGPK
ncbi:MAG TPA: hypothetical protein VHA11_01765 [Bryobacteraceae bacterium]|nr:hypothetical protein [Bryobacteraceae bacterium]